ncbi:MAG: PTS sugar transporter subunit IIA [Maricaulaceae bacterium]
MIGLVVVTHGRLAEELLAATEHVVGPQTGLRAVCIGPDDDIEDRRDEIRATAKSVDDGDGVLVLTDMFGGTPSNLAISIRARNRVEVLSGVNLPMLIKLVGVREGASLDDAARLGQDAGRKYISIASELLSGEAV